MCPPRTKHSGPSRETMDWLMEPAWSTTAALKKPAAAGVPGHLLEVQIVGHVKEKILGPVPKALWVELSLFF